MNPIHFDAILKNALTDNLLDEYADVILNAESRDNLFSRKYLEHRERMLKNPGSSFKKLSGYSVVIRIIAFAALILFMAMAAGAALLP